MTVKIVMAKDEILESLKRNERLSTTRIASDIKSDYNYALKLLHQLENAGKVIKEKETNSTYWRLSRKG